MKAFAISAHLEQEASFADALPYAEAFMLRRELI
jgi:hypothetical protein